ncbi:MAG: T9SS type A sorting domain-containing protein [Bacteroidales bacterium]
MKKLVIPIIILFFALHLPAQNIVVFHENFELPSLGDSLNSSTDPVGGDPWSITTQLKSSGLRSDSNAVQVGYTVYLTTNSFSTIGYSKVSLQFAQICKLYFSDGGQIEVSVDDGTTWTSLGLSQYTGSGNLVTTGGISKFSESAYTDWLPGDITTKPNNTWWKTETFNLSSIAANQADVKVRFKFFGSGNPLAAGRYGWLLDDIKVIAGNNEISAPIITFKTPVLKDTLYVTGPFTVKAYVKDSSAVASVNLLYNVNGGGDSIVSMTYLGDSTYVADIPSFSYNTLISYKIQASDIYNNSSSLPSGYQTFLIKKGLSSIQVGNTITAGLMSPLYIAGSTDANLYSYNVLLIDKSEILSGGTIESLAFSKADAQGYTLGNATLRIYMKGVSATAVPLTYPNYQLEKNGAIKVYESNSQNLNTNIGWQTFVCNTGSLFSHNGNENLMIFVEWYRPGNATAAVNWNYNLATSKSSIFYGGSSTPTTINTTGQRANIKINFQSSNVNYDATVLNFASPTQSMTAGVNVPVTARVKNLGSATLTKTKVHWMVDGVYQGVVNYSSSLSQDFVSLPLTLGSVNLTVGPHVLKAWTALPNDSIDQMPANDTTIFTVFACQVLNGSYTVGTPTSNFPTFNDMFTALNNCGLNGAVSFKIASGTYNQQLIIPLINNVSASNTVTFESATGNMNDVIFQYSSVGTADNFVLKLDAAKYVKVKNMSFKALGATYGRIMELANQSSYNTIEGCKLEMPITNSANYAGIYTANTIEQYNTFRNNTILNGYYGIYNYGTSATVLEKGNVIDGNTITGFYNTGIYSFYQDSVTINKNIVENSSNAAAVYGIYANYNDNIISISKNKVYVHSSGTNANYAIYVFNCDNTATQPGSIANNFCSQSGTTGDSYGLYSNTSTYQNYYYNSANITSVSSTAYAFYVNGGSNLNLYNNCFVNSGGGYAFYINTITAIVNSNYNNLYVTGSNLAYWTGVKTTLADLQASSGKDVNSLNQNPGYISISDLHVTNFSLFAAGTTILSVTDDVDGDVRPNPPCIGADEFILQQNDAGIVQISSPTSIITTLSQPVKIKLKNSGLLPLTSATIKWSVNGISQPAFSWIGNLNNNSIDSLDLGNYIFNPGQNTLNVYSEMPNGFQDMFNYNDTLSMNIYACSGSLSGIYSIGGNGADYPTVNSAVLALKSCGVSGPTVFNINPGIYNEQFVITKIPGVSASNTVTFKSANNDSSSVVFDITNNVGNNYVLKFDSAQYVKFSNVTLKNEIVSGRVVEFAGNSKYCEVSNSVLLSNIGTTNTLATVIYSTTSKDEFNIIKNNKILGGYYGIYWYGIGSASGSKEVGNVIQNNLIKDFYYYGMYAYYQDSLKIIGNTLQNHASSGTVYSLYSGYTDNAQYLKNNVQVSGSSTAYCMYLYYNNSPTGFSLVANNTISQSVGAVNVYGLYSYNSSNMNYYYNSVNITKGSTSTAYAFYITGGANCNLLNNNFVNTGGGYAYYVATVTAINTSNYNNIYTTGASLAFWTSAKANLAALKTASSKDQNSISINPVYYSTTDLHTDISALYAKGLSVSSVTDDMDGQTRASIPCIGADEYIVMPNDARVKALYTLGKLPIQSGSPHVVKTIVKNMGSNKLYNLAVTLSISGNNSFTNIKTIDSIASGVEDTISFNAFTPSAYGANNVKVSVPSDDVIANNYINYKQIVTDSVFGYADDTSAVTNYIGFNTASGLLLSKYHLNGSKVIKSVRAFIGNSNTVGQVIYGVILNQNGVIVDTSAHKTITATDANSWVSFNFPNQSATTTINSDFYVGIAQTIGNGGYYPLGSQTENHCRRGVFYYASSLTANSLIETTQLGRFMIEANLGLPAYKDASVTQVLTPVSGCGLASETVKIKIINSGLDPIYGGQNVLTAHYGLMSNGNLINIISQHVADTILPSQSITFSFSVPVNLAVTNADVNFNLYCWVDLTNDLLHFNDTLTKTVLSKYIPPIPTITTPVNINFGGIALLNAISNDSVYWYTNLNDTIPFASGLHYTTPALFGTKTYWVSASNNSITSNTQFVGPLNTSIGSGGSVAATSYNLIFDVLNPGGITIKNFDIYPSTAGSPFAMVVKNISGAVIQTYNGITTTTGTAQTVNVNFQIPFGTGYTLGFTSGPNFFRNTTGALFPYTIPNVVSITGTSYVGYPAYYYNAYNWEVFKGYNGITVTGCQSPKTPLVVNVAPGSDASVTEILSPNTGCGLSNQIVEIRIKNKGNLAINGSQNVLTAYYGLKVNNTITNVVSETVSNSISAFDSTVFSFSTPLTLAANTADSIHTIISWVKLINDLNIHNDTTNKVVKSKKTPITPVLSNVTIPYGSTATFNIVSTDSIYWYYNVNDMLPMASGNHFTTPSLYDTTTYYVSAGQVSESAAYVGEIAPLSTAGTGGGLTTYVNFTAISNSTLKTVDIFPYGTGAGTITLELRTSTGTPIMSQTFNVTGTSSPLSPAQTVTLDFPLSAGTSYRLGVNSWTGGVTNLYRDLTGTYPYVLPGVLSIDGTSLSPYYYFFYHWQVTTGGSIGGSSSSNNVGLTAISTQSGGGASPNYGPEIYNDGVIPAYGTTGTGIWGWVTTAGWIEYTWTNPATFNKVVFYKDNRPMSSCTFQYWNGSSYVDFLSYSNTNADDSLTFPNITTTKLRFNNISGTAANPNFREIQVFSPGGGCSSPRIPVTISVTSSPAIDIAATQITEPSIAVTTGAPTPVKVIITNYGTTPITSATIKWSVNGIAQADVPWTGLLTNGQASVPIALGDAIFTGGPGVIKAWTNSPNGLVDMFPVNDTITKNVLGCFTGNFTIGAGGTFPTFNTALNTLLLAGICGNVIFDVLPGTYNEVLTISQIPNVGQNSTITFRSITGINTSVILTAATGAAVIKLNGADYIRFEKIYIKGTGTITAGVELSGGATNNIFDGNIIEIPGSTAAANRVINSTSVASDNYNQFINNSISGGYYGVYWYGSATLPKKASSFINNTISNFYYYGLYLYYNDSVTVSRNTITNASNAGIVYGLYAYYNNNSIFTKNNMNITGSSTAYCMYFSYNNNTTGYSLVANNFVSQSVGTAGVYGIYNYYSNNINYYNNSVNISGGSTAAYSFYSTNGASNNVVNNIFSNTGGGYAYYIATPVGINTSNYNDFYGTGINLAYWTSAHTTLASLKTASGKDQNSLSVNPNFFSPSNLHMINFNIDGKGTPLTAVPDDIDGDTRNTTIPDMGADEFVLPNNDAGISALAQPTNPVTAGTQTVNVVIKNYGVYNITSAIINWSVNGILQTSFPWTGNLISAATATVNLGSYNFTGNYADMRFWTSMPNGTADQLNMNDTLSTTITICTGPLSGNYTIGGSSANFLTINQAVQSLIYCGVNAAVTFNINPGTYNEQIRIPAITGASLINTITFKSASNDSSSVVISYNVASVSNNYILKLDAAKYIKFKYLSLVNNTQLNFGNVVELANAASNNELSNNVIQTVISTVNTTAGIYSNNAAKDERNVFSNNLITGGYYGIYLSGIASANGSKEIGNTITNNIIKDFYYYGLYLYYQDSIKVIGNTIRNGSNSAIAYGLYSYYSDNISYRKNNIHLNNSGTTYCLYLYYNNNSGGNGLVANNFVSQSVSTGTVYGIYNYYSTNIKYYYNSVNVTAGNAAGYSMYLTGGSTISLRNNSLVNTGNGYAIYAASTTSISTSNYNNLFVTGANLGYWGAACANLTAWKTASNQDVMSISGNPDYFSTTNLHVYTPTLNNVGIAVTEVADDIDGQPRSATTPDIGADEYAPLPIDIGVTTILSPVNNYSQVGSNITVKVRIKNLGADSVSNFQVVYKVGNATAVSQPYTGYLLSNKADTITFAVHYSVVAGPLEISAYTSYANDINHNNDTVKMNYFGVPLKTIPYSENFDGTTEEWFQTGGAMQWEHGIPNASVINTAHSSPNVWATVLNGNYANASLSYLYTPVFDNWIFKVDTLKFWFWMNAEANKDGGRIEFTNDGGVNWNILGGLASTDTNSVNWYNGATLPYWTGLNTGWQQAKYAISKVSTLGNTIQFRFVFTSDAATNYNGWAIDDFEITLAPIPKDAGVIAVTSPAASVLVGDFATVTVNLKNFGTDVLTNIPMNYQVGSGSVQTGIYAGPLVPGAAATYTFPQAYHVTNVNFPICAYTTISGDFYTQNDKTCKNVIVNPAPIDAGITEIIKPAASASIGTTPIKVVIKNFGSTTQTSIPLSYQRNAITPVDAIWTGSLAAGDTIQYTFPTPMNVPSGTSFGLCVFTRLANDAYVFNDTLCKSVSICNVATAGNITGPATVSPGATAVAYSVPAIANATSYNWVYTPSTGVTINGTGASVTIDFGANATNGVLSVNGVSAVCSGTASTKSITGLGTGISDIDENGFSLGQNIPNPTTGLTNIEYTLPTAGEVKFNIMNLLGQVVYSMKEKSEMGKHLIELNVKDFSTGIYYYTIEFKEKRLLKKMVVNK